MQSRSYNETFMNNNSRFKTGDIYKIGDYEVFMNNKIGIGRYSVVYIGRCANNTIATKHQMNIKKRIILDTQTGIQKVEYNNIVAIKKIIRRDATDKIKNNINDEILIMNMIKEKPHENIISCYEIIEEKDAVYIIMEYCELGDMSRIVGKTIDDDTIMNYTKQICNGLVYLEQCGIIHRDIKPKNILMTKNNIIKICDFGLAKNIILDNKYIICGSPLYMAPEMILGREYNEKIDIWGIGIIIYELIYGVNPYNKIKDRKELETIMNGDNLIEHGESTSKMILLMNKILIKDIDKRISLKEIIKYIDCANIKYSETETDTETDNNLMFEIDR
jgi:serine/threonine protein kinase